MCPWWEPGVLVPTAGVLPAHSSKEIPQKAMGNKLLQQQWFQLMGSAEGLCRLGHHGLAATTQGADLSMADVTQTHTLMWAVPLWFTWTSQPPMTSVSSSYGCLTLDGKDFISEMLDSPCCCTQGRAQQKCGIRAWSLVREWGQQHTWRGEFIAFPLKGQGWSSVKV